MARMMLLKPLQRFVYDSMSIKHSTYSFASIVVILCLASLLVVWLLLGQERCPAQASSSDNILDRPVSWPFPIQPVDVVYTWVNGSDPEFQRDLRAAESRLRRSTPPGWRQSCPLASCLLSSRLSVVPPLPRRMALKDVRFFIHGATPLEMLPSPALDPPATVLRFASVDDARSVLRSGAEFHINQDNFTLHQMFWTSDESAALSAAAPDHVLLSGPAEALPRLLAELQKSNAEEVARSDDDDVVVLRLPDPADVERLLVAQQNETVKAVRAVQVLRLVDAAADAVAPSRFADSQELRYSLRSLERYAPWVRHVYLVTNGQIPDWLALDHPRLTLVTHEEIFPDASHLPTFSSPAIEAHLSRIPGLSEHFLYFNDDVLLGQPVWPEDFATPGDGYSVFLAWRVPDCALDCSATWLRDGHCDAACNTASCDWDAGDCVGVEPEPRPSASPDPVEEDADQDAEPLVVVDAQDGCSPSCEDAWLGDHFCDAGCDVAACAHDLGDCGVKGLRALPDLGPLRDGAEYVMPAGALAAYWNISRLPGGLQPEAVSSPPRRAVRGLALTLRSGVLTLLLRPNATLGRLPVFLSGTALGEKGEGIAEEEKVVEFYVVSEAETEPPVNVAEEARRLGRLVAASNKWDAELERRLQAVERRLSDPSAYLRRRVELLNRAVNARNATAHLSEQTGNAVRGLNSSVVRTPGRRLLGARPVAFVASKERLLDLEPANDTRWEPEDDGPRPELPPHLSRYIADEPSPVDQLDTYGLSLLTVNRLYTRRYGAEQRRAVAHMPHLLSRGVIADMQATFADEFARTSAARLRSGEDMQFAFAYFYFLMSERVRVSAGEMFDTIDTDGSGTWSDREIRTLLAKLKALPLTRDDLEQMWALLRGCAGTAPAAADLSTPAGERYLDSDLPTITRAAVLSCAELVSQLERTLGNRTRYPHRVLDASEIVSFTMVRSNSSLLVGALDALRREPRKFICLNNNVGAAPEAETRLVYALLVDFLEALLPRPSQFELPANYRNRFQHVRELREWERQRGLLRAAAILLTLLMLASLLHAQLVAAICARRRRTRRLVVEL